MKTRNKYAALILLAAAFAVGTFVLSNSRQPARQIMSTDIVAPRVAGAATAAEIQPAPKLFMPISGSLARVTKKPFELYVTPQTSPVANDIFTGYHTGIDFETFPSEQNTDVTITAACDGTALLKKWASGYGGVFVQSCKIDGEDVTVIYGHLNLASIMPAVGQTISAGDKIGYLGQGNTAETDGRRMHLHFDIHKGTEINILGYVGKQDELANWLDPMKYLQ